MKFQFLRQNGYTAVEMLIVAGIVAFLGIALAVFQSDIFVGNRVSQLRLNAQQEIRSALRKMVTELRTAASSEEGAYPISVAREDEISFYSDTDSDGLREKIRYFLDGSVLKRGIIIPSGSPLSYNSLNETISTLVSDVVNAGGEIFLYYDGNFTGVGNPLSQPVAILDVRLIQITLTVDRGPDSPYPITDATQVTVRSLRGAQ